MKNRVFSKYEILRKFEEKQLILRQNTKGITVKQLKNAMRKGSLKLIYDICYNNASKGLLQHVSGQGWNRKYKLTTDGVNRLKWIQEKR